ncbi:uncharacterized protein [Pleurodeles waltl]|uniref:uncharacterized protein n=1 Tax=Pleurodeles waltl TaxID=8319 RepID=UPI003709AC95
MPILETSRLATDGLPSEMERVRRTVLDPEQAFEEVYKSLVRRNQDVSPSESRSGVQKRSYNAISARLSSTFSMVKENVPGDPLHNTELSSKKSESVVEKHTCQSATLSTHFEFLDSPGAKSLNLSTKTAVDLKLHLQHERSLVEEYDSAAWISECNTKEASNVSEEPLSSETSGSDDESALSGQSHVNINEEVCKDCRDRYCKTLKDPSASIKEPDVVDPNHWSCNYWMMRNGVRKKSVNLKKRDFLTLLKYLQAQAQLSNLKSTTRPGRCSRPHAFLQRNLKSCRRSRRNSSSMKSKGWEIGREKCRRDVFKLNTGKKLNRSTELGKEKKKQLFVYKVDTDHVTKDNIKRSQTGDDDGTVTMAKKKQTSSDQGTENEMFAQRSSKSRMHDTVSGSQPKLKNLTNTERGNSMEDSLLDLSSDSLFSIAVEDSEEEGSELHSDGDSSLFGLVGGGSFREMLAKMTTRPSGKVVREYSVI